jgi:hypothetical protein
MRAACHDSNRFQGARFTREGLAMEQILAVRFAIDATIAPRES